jgi:hypothetical protein
MRRLLASAILAVALAAPAIADAAGPPITNISPASGSTISVSAGSTVRVEYSCPPYTPSYSTTRLNGEGYFAEFASSPEVNALDEFPEYNLLDLGRGIPTVANPAICETSFFAEDAAPGSTVYWHATRINCDVESCVEAGPIWTFAESTAAPILPTTPAPTPTPATPTVPSAVSGEGHVTVYVGCGLTRNTTSSPSCAKNQPMGAFFKDSKETSYTVCVHYPGGSKSCAHAQHAEANTVYVNAIKRHSAGRYTVVWTVGARRFEKVISRRAR